MVSKRLVAVFVAVVAAISFTPAKVSAWEDAGLTGESGWGNEPATNTINVNFARILNYYTPSNSTAVSADDEERRCHGNCRSEVEVGANFINVNFNNLFNGL